ncbi:TOBE domain-containing protein [Streptomyces rubiginosohelvolus]|uniref:TOBE domain-containing protein n=1 Tax=Streptomyces rubiginosohelvolus TaxID=67362 RepID=UPI00371D8D31
MALSIRNQLPGTVVSVVTGEAISSVTVRLRTNQLVTAAITSDAAKELSLVEGTEVTALAKSTDISLATADSSLFGLSIRNKLPASVTHVSLGGAMASVELDAQGAIMTAAVTRSAAQDLQLSAGDSVIALIKATDLSLATV